MYEYIHLLDHVSDASQVIGNKNIDIDTDMGNVTIHFKGE